MHYYTKHIKDYKTDTAHLTLLEHGVYNSLIDLYILTENPLEPDLQKLCRLVHAKTDDEINAVENVLTEFFIESDDGYRQKKCDQELIRIFGKSESARKSAKHRWSSERNANVVRKDSERNANAMLPNTQDPLPNNPLPNKDFVKFWEAYPNKKSKPIALKAWLKHKPDINVVMKSLTIFKKCEQWTRDKGRYIPHPASWLNAEGWNDEAETKKVNSTYSKYIKER